MFEVIIEKCLMNQLYKSLSDISNQEALVLANDFESSEWRMAKFINYLLDNMHQGALSIAERKALITNDQFHSVQVLSANNLRLDNKGGEIGEILLHGILKDYYRALPIVPKIFYKQNSNLYANGADSVHLVLDDNDYALWLGEAKFYSSLDKGFTKAIKSIEDLLNNNDGKLRKEFQLITNLEDLKIHLNDKPELLNEINKLINNDTSLDYIMPKINIPILILHECTITKNHTTNPEYFAALKTEYENELEKMATELHQKLNSFSDVNFYIIVFPVPDKDKIIEIFNKKIENIRG